MRGGANWAIGEVRAAWTDGSGTSVCKKGETTGEEVGLEEGPGGGAGMATEIWTISSVQKRRIARDHRSITSDIGGATSAVAPWMPSQRLGHRHPRPAIFIAAEQETSAPFAAKSVRGDALENLMTTVTTQTSPEVPNLVNIRLPSSATVNPGGRRWVYLAKHEMALQHPEAGMNSSETRELDVRQNHDPQCCQHGSRAGDVSTPHVGRLLTKEEARAPEIS